MQPPIDENGADFSAWGLVGQVGFIMLITLGAGFAVGLAIDKFAGTKPLFTLIGVTIGFAVGIAAVYRAATAMTRRAEAAYLKRRRTRGNEGPKIQQDPEDE